jgi:hypothetical protein
MAVQETSDPETVRRTYVRRMVPTCGDVVPDRRWRRLAFNPWHALAEHRPMGGINRLRKAVY